MDIITTSKADKNFFASILPQFGTEMNAMPIWDASQRLFIVNQYESASGHHYYRGVRFCQDLLIMECVGLSYHWTYLDSLSLFAFDGHQLVLIQKKDYQNQFHDKDFIKDESRRMLHDYITGMARIQHCRVDEKEVEQAVERMITAAYKDFLDNDYSLPFQKILQLLPSDEF